HVPRGARLRRELSHRVHPVHRRARAASRTSRLRSVWAPSSLLRARRPLDSVFAARDSAGGRPASALFGAFLRFFAHGTRDFSIVLKGAPNPLVRASALGLLAFGASPRDP